MKGALGLVHFHFHLDSTMHSNAFNLPYDLTLFILGLSLPYKQQY